MNNLQNTFLLLLSFTSVIVIAGATTAATGASSGDHIKFEEYGLVCAEDEKARLDNFAIELQHNPELQGYVIFYGGRCWAPCDEYYTRGRHPRYPRKGEAETRGARIKPFLVDYRRLDPDRIIVINGGNRETWTAELWFSPKGAGPPPVTPTVQSRDIKYRKGKPGKREFCRASSALNR